MCFLKLLPRIFPNYSNFNYLCAMFFNPTKILSFLFIVLCVYGSSGFYVGDYCCNICQEVGIEVVLADECHKIHETENHTECSDIGKKDTSCNRQCIEKRTCCSVTAYKVDDYFTDFKCHVRVPIFDLPYPLRHLLNNELTASSFQESPDSYFLPAYSPRERLILHSTFLI